jgi:hypothetical protein
MKNKVVVGSIAETSVHPIDLKNIKSAMAELQAGFK